jgi:ribulose-phosphate 3-epimerase
MPVICPTITATNALEYRQQMEQIEEFVERLHLDFMDGIFAPTKSPDVAQAWWPIGTEADLHVMYKSPLEHLETIISLQPSLVVIHAEADHAAEFFKEIEGLGIKRGIALLSDSKPEEYEDLIKESDHVLIFSGNLGHFGGIADTDLLGKVAAVKRLNPHAEIGWDGGINDTNARELADGGVDVLNVGGFIHRAHDPKKAYDTLKETLAS